jgi:hypothetical protein
VISPTQIANLLPAGRTLLALAQRASIAEHRSPLHMAFL